MKRSLAAILLVLLLATVSAAANTDKCQTLSDKYGVKVGAPGVQLTNNSADPTHADLASGRLSVKNNVLRFYNGSSWANVATGTAGTADAVYNAGAWLVTVDSGDVGFDLNALANAVKIYANITGTQVAMLVLDAEHSTSDVTDAISLTTTGASAAIEDGLDASDTGITNAVNVGGNTIVGTTGVIDFTDFDVSADGCIALATDTAGATAMITAAHAATSGTQNDGIVVSGASGLTITDGLDVSDGEITNAINIGGNAIAGTNFSVTAAGNVTCVDVTGSGTGAFATFTANAITAKTANTDLNLDGSGSGGVVLNATGTGGITLTRNVTCTGDVDIDGGDVTCPADLTITPTGGDVDINAADLWLDSTKHLALDGVTDSNYITLDTDVKVIATADVLIDPAGGDVDFDAADILIDAAKHLSLNGSTDTAYITLDTDIKIVSTADILLDPTGGDVDIDAATVWIDSGEKLSLNGSTETATVYLSTDLQIASPADVVVSPTGGQVDFNVADIAVDSGKKVGLNGIASLANDFLYLSTDVKLSATADVEITAGGGQVDISGADIAVDAGEYISLAGIATIAEAALIYQNSAVEVFCNEVNVADFTATGLDVTGAVTMTGSATFTGGQTRKIWLGIGGVAADTAASSIVLDSANPPSEGVTGTAGQAEFACLKFDANPNATGDDIVYIHWRVPDGYKDNTAVLNIHFIGPAGEVATDDIAFDGTVNAVASGEGLDAAGTGMTLVTDEQTTAVGGEYFIAQLDIEVEEIDVDDLVTIMFFVDEGACELAVAGTVDIIGFEIEYESTE